MCPACLATISMMVAGLVSTGGVTALAVKTIGRRKASGNASESADSGKSEFLTSDEKENDR